MRTFYTTRATFPILIAAMLVTLAACTSNTKETTVNERAAYTVPDSVMRQLKIDTVTMSNLSTSIRFNGVVDFNPDKVANVFPLVSGNVQDVRVMLGDYVRAGQVLGIIKSAEIAGYNAALVNAETNVKLMESLLNRQKEMAKSGLASQIDVTTATVNYQQALAAKTAAEKVLHINGNNRNGEFLIKAPIDGFIVQKNITNGMSIRTDNTTALFTISDLKEVWVQANVYEANINKVHLQDDAEVSTISYPDKIYFGRIGQLTNVLDPTNRVMKMRVVLPNPGYLLKPQMFATVTVNKSLNEKAISVPASALIFDHSQYYVVVYYSPKDVRIRPVDVISTNSQTAFIRSGLAIGEKVISSQAILIYGALNN